MNLLEKFGLGAFSKKEQDTWSEQARMAAIENSANNPAPESYYRDSEYQIYETIYDGEKTQGELGAPLSYMPDYNVLSYRSWQAYTDSDIAQIIVKNTVNWVVGAGLKIQAEPNEDIINSEGFALNKESFTKQFEDRFRLFAKTNNASYNQMSNFNKLQRTAYLNAIVGGDVLVIQRIADDNLPNIQLIDGVYVQTPHHEEQQNAEERGNKIVHGVEIKQSGKNKGMHVAYYVLNSDNKYDRIVAVGAKSGRATAFLLYGTEYRIDSVRGLPLLSAVLEKIKKLDRYNEAIVGGSEERAKVPWSYEHGSKSTGENPDIGKLGSMLNDPTEAKEDDLVVDMTAQTTAIRKTFEKEPINMPIDSKLVVHSSGMETNQEAFTTGNFIFICAAVETPYEMALMRFVNSFSSSRMASQSYQHILNIKRSLFTDEFLSKFSNLFLDTQVLSGKINVDGYFSAQNKKDVILLQAYRNVRFTGPGVPQANPLHEVKAVVDQIENNLLTHEEGIERLGNKSDFDQTINRLGEEKTKIIEKTPTPPEQENNNE